MTCHMPINWATRYKSYPVETNFPTWEKWFRTLKIQAQNAGDKVVLFMVMTNQKPLQRHRKSAKRENPSIRIVSL